MILWFGMVSLSLSTAVLLAVLSRHLHHQGFAGLSTLFGLLFIASLIPSGIPLRAASLIADGEAPPNFTGKSLIPAAVVGLGISPLLGMALGLPTLAVALVALQVLLAFPLAVRRGALIAFGRFTFLGINILIEAVLRTTLGCLAGILWGVNGLVAGLAVATCVALLILPTAAPKGAKEPRPLTPMFDTWLTVVLMGVLVQLDILLAASGMSKTAATQYDVAAVPSKGVYLVLVALSVVIFPYVRAKAEGRVVVIAAMITTALGFVITGTLVLLRDVIAQVLGQDVASVYLLVSLGCAMTLAGGTSVISSSSIALGVTRPWPPLLLGLLALFACWLARPTPDLFATAVLVVQAGVMLLSIWVCLSGRRGAVLSAPGVPVPTSSEPRPEPA